MQSVVITGSGRCGTSMVAESLAGSGYEMGGDLMPATPANPRGFFESQEVRNLNEDILDLVLPQRINSEDRQRPPRFAGWMASLPLDVQVQSTPVIDQGIKKLTSDAPFCIKDPRLSYTLPVWRPYLGDAVFICMFREPAKVALSMIKVTRTHEWFKDFDLSVDAALDAWTHLNRHILEVHRLQGNWLFLHYDQVLHGDGLQRIARFTGARVDPSVLDAKLDRTQAHLPLSPLATDTYKALCELAEY